VHQGETNRIRLCIAANFTIEPIEEVLTYWLDQLGVSADIHFAAYNQIFQQLLEGGLLRSNPQGINLVGLDLDAWLVDGPFDEGRAQLDRTVADFLALLRSAAAQGVGGAVLVFPPAANAGQLPEHASAVRVAREAIFEGSKSVLGWSALDLSTAVTLYSVAQTRDPFTDELGNIPFTEDMYAAAATAAARWIRSTRTKPRKVIVLDCDNTLWQGICGEGPVQLTPPYRRLHEFMLRQRDEGVLLAIASKNNEGDVMAVLDSPDCVLKLDHFTSCQINWQAKSENLKTISEELGLALNSFLFLDDSPYECLEVRNSCPEVLTIQLPQEPEAIPAFLEHMWAFDRPAATDEDRNRAGMYAAERQRTDLSKRALTREEFLAGLKIEIQIARAAEADLARVAQLTHRTTQFNMTGVTHTVQSLTAKLSQPGSECWTVRVRDVFGDYGLVGTIVFDTARDHLRVDTFLLSCRALGRGVEERMMDDLKLWAVERGAESIVIPFVPTARNRPAFEFISRYCDTPTEAKGPFDCVLSAAGTASEWRPTESPAAPELSAPTAVSSPPAKDPADLLARIAGELQTVEAILGVVRNQMKHRPSDAGPFVAPQSGIEVALARIWSECLAVEPIGATDNFFDFGGQSLIATRILARVRTEFGVEMGLTNLFERPTVKQMAAYIGEAIPDSSRNCVEAISRQN
jgi:FkbH-like protein